VTAFWPDGARLAVSFSLMFEGGGQPISGAGGVIPERIEGGRARPADQRLFAYGHYEGIPRVLDLMDRHGIKLSSFMIGKAVETSPDLAREIVRRGHEAAAHGRAWENSYQLPPDEEKRSPGNRLVHRIEVAGVGAVVIAERACAQRAGAVRARSSRRICQDSQLRGRPNVRATVRAAGRCGPPASCGCRRAQQAASAPPR
jgi:peptidoglycan/xylan/chitin deacetylase (PgdA/CDA1 family)